MEITNTSGRRKTSVARIYMQAGQGNITINDRDMKSYFRNELLENDREPALRNPRASRPVRHQGERARRRHLGSGRSYPLGYLQGARERQRAETRPALKKEGFLTRDPRMVERKKFGKRKARRSFQFSKR